MPAEMPPFDELSATAAARWGIQYLFPYQRLVVTAILEAVRARSAVPAGTADAADTDQPPNRLIVILPTGAGKSLCFQLPAVLVEGITLIVYPLLSLMSDQLRRMNDGGIPSGSLRGGQTAAEREAVFNGVQEGSLKVILTNPETLLAPGMLDRLRTLSISLLVIDEAHCISEWGLSFRPTYLELYRAVTALNPPVVAAFTATASPPVLRTIREYLFERSKQDTAAEQHAVHSVIGDPDRPNISYSVVPSLSKNHDLITLFTGSVDGRAQAEGLGTTTEPIAATAAPTAIASTAAPSAPSPATPPPGAASGAVEPVADDTAVDTAVVYPEDEPVPMHGNWAPGLPVVRPAIVFCTSRRGTEETAVQLAQALGTTEVRAYHAGMSKPEKNAIEAWFFDSPDGILCATCAYGMGVDKANIRTVIHRDYASSVEAYLQESGRAGRDRESADAILMVSPSDLTGGRRKDHVLGRYVRAAGCRRTALLGLMGAEPGVCFGCDRCRGTNSEFGDSIAWFHGFFARHSRRFSTGEAVRFLCGRLNPQLRDAMPWLYRDFGALAAWQPDDVRQAIEELIAAGVIRRPRWGLWKGCLVRVRG